MSINFVPASPKLWRRRLGFGFNLRRLRPRLKLAFFLLAVTLALVVATNPHFVLPYKYRYVEPIPAAAPGIEPLDISSLTTLPDGAAWQPPPEPIVTEAPPVVLDAATAASPVAKAPLSAPKNSTPPKSATNSAKAPATSAQYNQTLAWPSGSLIIASLRIQTPVVYVAERSEKLFQLGLQQGVVHYPGTALPGQVGNMYVFGHSSDYRWAKGNYKTIFAKLPEIKVGSEIELIDGAGKVYVYKVTSRAIALPSETKYLSQYNYQKKILTVQTSYPVGTALKRFLAIAELVE